MTLRPLYQTVMFVDLEGHPPQELAAMVMHTRTYKIIDIFLEYASFKKSNSNFDDDNFCRRNVHGLNLKFLNNHGVESPEKLRDNFLEWYHDLYPKPSQIFANNPGDEVKFLGLEIENLPLPKWIDRQFTPTHLCSRIAKYASRSFLGVSCDMNCAHSSYKPFLKARKESDIARRRHGVHCALYDVYELYLFFTCE